MLVDQNNKQASIVILGDDKTFSHDVKVSLHDAGYTSVMTSGTFDLVIERRPELLFFCYSILDDQLKKVLHQLKSLPWSERCPVVCLAENSHDLVDENVLNLFDDFVVFPRDINRIGIATSTLLNVARERKAWLEDRAKMERELERKTQKADHALVLLKQAERKILNQHPEKIDLDEENKNIIADMSHELRTPLNAILGFSEIMKQERLGSLGHEKYLGYAGDIHNASKHLLGIVNDVLDLAKTDSQEENLHITEVSVKDAVKETFRLMALLAEESGIELSLNIPDDFPVLKTDERRFKQVLTNVVSNAVKFTRSGGRVSVEGQFNQKDGAILMVIRDNGIGMSSDELALALSPYGQVLDAQVHTHVRGTGLGLPVSKRSIEALGGEFLITSEPGLGTAITLRFPPDLVVKRR